MNKNAGVLVASMLAAGCSKDKSPRLASAEISFSASTAVINNIRCPVSAEPLRRAGHASCPTSADTERSLQLITKQATTVAAFTIDRDPVTCAAWKQCIAEQGCAVTRSDMLCLGDFAWASHDEAVEYCRWRSGRLPTYGEWQRAMRGVSGNTSPYQDEHMPSIGCPLGRSISMAQCEHSSPEGVVYVFGNPEWLAEVKCGSDREPAMSMLINSVMNYRLDTCFVVLKEMSRSRNGFRCAR